MLEFEQSSEHQQYAHKYLIAVLPAAYDASWYKIVQWLLPETAIAFGGG